MTDHTAKTPVIMLHSCGNSSRQWASLAADTGSEFMAVCPELLGYGKTGEPVDLAKREMDDMVVDIVRTITIFDEPVHVVGHSFGGAVALKLASSHPDLVKSLTLIEPAAFNLLWSEHGAKMPELGDLMAMKHDAESAFARGDFAASMRAFVDFWNGAGTWDALPAEQASHLASKAHLVQADFGTLTRDRFTRDDLARITCPVLNICGSLSPDVIGTVSSELSVVLQQMAQVTIAGVGHMAPITHPDRINPVISAFLAHIEAKCQDTEEHLPVAA